MQLQISQQIKDVMERALALAVNRGQFFVGVEHLFAALLEDADVLPQCIRENYLDQLYMVMREVAHSAWSEEVRADTSEIFHTPRAIRAAQETGKLAERYGRTAATPGHLLLALLSDPNSAPSRAMDRLGQNRKDCLTKLCAELSQGQDAIPTRPAKPTETSEPAQAGVPAQGSDTPAPSVDSMLRNLTERARQGKLPQAIGRDKEILEILQILARKTKNNVMIVGDAGVGKTQVVEGLANRIAIRNGKDSLIPDYQILELNVAGLMAGTQYRGAFEEKVLALLEKLKQDSTAVLFIDEVHLIMGAGATGGDSIDLANLLKPAMARGDIRCIGATTLQEYRKFVEKDPAIERRFQMVRIDELSEEATLAVLERLRPSLEKHHRVRITTRALHAAIQLTQRYMPNRRFPDKAIDALDQACARYRMKVAALRDNIDIGQTIKPDNEASVTPHDVRKVVSQLTSIPIEEMTEDARQQIVDLDRRLMQRLLGQDEAVRTVVSVVKKSRAGLADPNRPNAVLLFLGPSGVGKTQLAKQLAVELFGSQNHLFTFDMSEYIEEHSVSRLLGAPPGYAGCEEEGRLSAAIRSTPFSILLFDEIEKAHPRIFDIFLPIFDEGRLKDARGQNLDFRHCIIILTSNIGANLLYRSESNHLREELTDELTKHFRPEFINRIEEIVPFYPLLAEDVRNMLRLEINQLRSRLKDRGIGVRMYQQAYEFLAQEGYSPEYGARHLQRTVNKHVTSPISGLLIEGTFGQGDMIDVMMEDGKLVMRKGRPHSASLAGSNA